VTALAVTVETTAALVGEYIAGLLPGGFVLEGDDFLQRAAQFVTPVDYGF
jgi:hypothetical protein